MLLTLFCWFAVIFFIGGNVCKFLEYSKKPMHGRQDLYPIPAEDPDRVNHGGSYYESQQWFEKPHKRNLAGEILDMLEEIFFIKKLFHKQKKLWWISYALHLGIYCVVAALVLVAVSVLFPVAGVLAFLISTSASIAAIAGGVMVCIGTVGLIVKRITDREFRVYTTPQEYFNLGLLFAGAFSGLLAWLSHGRSIGFAKNILSGMLRFRPIRGLNGFSVLHVLLFGALLIYIPLTKMTHYVGKFFAFHQVIWDNEPNLPGSDVEEKIIEQASIKPDPDMQWSAPHYKQ